MKTLITLCALVLVVGLGMGIPAKAVASETPGRPIGDPGGSRWNGLFCCCCQLDSGHGTSPALTSAPAPSTGPRVDGALRDPRTWLSQWVARMLVLRLI